jgi:hypothetical protein
VSAQPDTDVTDFVELSLVPLRADERLRTRTSLGLKLLNLIMVIHLSTTHEREATQASCNRSSECVPPGIRAWIGGYPGTLLL